ncbi:hypothetical protein [Methylobacterium indicum]|uniref:hypothetical protein n=1 Tax=Methylobacterium indicum TaxID=1775910 RepID=UPI000A57EB59|nr:hypothetical protein [Methylobacterium indicum]
MISANAVPEIRMTSSATALKILNDVIATAAPAKAAKAWPAFDATSQAAKALSNRVLDAMTTLKTLDNRLSPSALASLSPAERNAMRFVAPAPYIKLPDKMLHEPIPKSDEAFMRGLGADGWVAHYAPRLSTAAFEEEARRSISLTLENYKQKYKEMYQYYKNAFEDENTQYALSHVDGMTPVSRKSLESAMMGYRIQMSLDAALKNGNITFSRPEDEAGLDYIGVSYDMYKDGEFHGNLLNYKSNPDYHEKLMSEGTVPYTWGIGLLGFLAKFKLLSMSEIEGAA